MVRRILVVSPYFYPEGGGLERYAFWVSRMLAEGYSVHVLCMTREEGRDERSGSVTVRRVGTNLVISNTPVSLRFVLEVARLVKDADIVVAHTPVPFASDVASFFAKILGIPFKVVYHTVGLEKDAGILDLIAKVYSRTLERFTLWRADLVAVSHRVWEYLRDRGYHPAILYPTWDLGEMDSSCEGLANKENIVLFVGQLGEYSRFKNLGTLIKAFAIVSSRYPEWELWVVGGGDLLEEYRRLVLDMGLSGRVRFIGRVLEREKLWRIYNMSKILVVPSSSESFGMVVPEAMIRGTPAIVSKGVGAIVLVEAWKSGAVVDRVSPEELSRVLMEFMENPKMLRKMGFLSRLIVTRRMRGCDRQACFKVFGVRER